MKRSPERQRQLMNSMYRYQKYFYDFTRRYYLLGREELLKELVKRNPQHILEVGCGTGRNLFKLRDALGPSCQLIGVDISDEMISTAEKINRKKGTNIHFVTKAIEELTTEDTNEVDTIFCSFSLSMIPNYQECIKVINNILPEKGQLWVIDFFDFKGLPVVVERGLRAWLQLFDVQYSNHALQHLKDQPSFKIIHYRELYKRYSLLLGLENRMMI